jgi:hypothetical protein
MMRILTIAVAAVAVLYGGYWFAAQAAARQGALRLADNLRAAGWSVDYATLGVAGFPNRIDVTVTGLAIGDPATGIGWTAPEFLVAALAYAPNRVIAVWPAEQELRLPGETIAVAAEGLRASAAVGAATALPLDRVTAESGALHLRSDRGWEAGLGRMLAAVRRAGPGPADYDVFAEAAAVAPPGAISAALDPGGTLPAVIDRIRLDARVTLSRPLDRFAADGAVVTAIALRQAEFVWGPVRLSLTGDLALDAEGFPEGRLTVGAAGWDRLIAMAVAAGLLSAEAAPGWQRAAEAAASGASELSAPIILSGGRIAFGPIPLGPAPRLVAY